MSESEKQIALVAVQPTALTKAGVNSLVARGRADLRINEEAEEWLKKGCELRDQESYDEAFVCFMRGIELNPHHSELQFMLGSMYEHGDGATQDAAQAVAWYRKAAENGHSGAQFNLGLLYDLGSGQNYRDWLVNPDRVPLNEVKQDRTQAIVWYRRAADQGNSDAQYNLGFLYENGQGVSQDYEQAEHWYRKAADQGNSSAQDKLGTIREQAEKQYEKGFKRRAAEHVKSGGNEGAIFLKNPETDPLVRVANEVFQKAARRKVN
jgi:TPR repeat protein